MPELKAQLKACAAYHQKHKRCFFADYLQAEEQNKVRWIYSNESVAVFAPFSPRGFNQVNIVVKNCSNIAAMSEKQVEGTTAIRKKKIFFTKFVCYNFFAQQHLSKLF